ncbi:MAG: DMT family transporter [Pseudomonadota bacterium]
MTAAALPSGHAYALSCIVLWSLIPVVSRFGQTSLDNFQFLFWSNGLSLLVVSACMFAAKGLSSLRRFSPGQVLYVIFLGALGCAVYYLCLYYGYAHGAGIEVLVLQYSWPLLIIVLSVLLLGERLAARAWVAVGAGFLGILVVLTRGDLLSLHISSAATSAVVLMGAFAFALFSVLSKRLGGEPYAVTTLLFVGGLLVSAVCVLTASEFALPKRTELVPVVVNGALVNGVSYILWLKALERAAASVSAVLVFLSPVLSSIWIVVFFHEPFSLSYLVGFVLVLGAGYVCVQAGTGATPATPSTL